MLELLDYLVIFALSGLSLLLGAYVGYKYMKPKVKRMINGYSVTLGNRIKKEMTDMGKEALEELDLSSIGASLGGVGGEGAALGDLAGLLGGGSGGLSDLIGLLGQFGGQGKQKFKKPDARPGK